MKNFTLVSFVFLVFGLAFTTSVQAQSNTPEAIALDYVSKHYSEWNLEKADVADLFVSDIITDKTTGKSNVYLTQRHKGIEIYNALINVGVNKDGVASHINHTFIKQVASRVNTTSPQLQPEDAIQAAVVELGGAMTRSQLVLKEQPKANVYVFEKGNISIDDIKVKLTYQPIDGELYLAWMLDINRPGSPDYWSMRVDAKAGKVINRNNYTLYCNHGADAKHEHTHQCKATPKVGYTYGKKAVSGHKPFGKTSTTVAVNDGSSYNVFPMPTESPIHGAQMIVSEPADLQFSPQGWHDTDGMPGAEYTITRGNNVHAFDDRPGVYSPNSVTDGGANLEFNFPYDADNEPGEMIDAAVTNLFFWNNVMHDFSAAYGFTEDCGNFQETNFGGMGVGGDYVNALAQFGATDTINPSRNNATFGTPPDGGSGTMRMFVWNQAGSADFAIVDSPVDVVGSYPSAPANGWGATFDATGVSGEVLLAQDGIPDPLITDACEPLSNADDLDGKIVMIDRGGCEFGSKSLKAQEAGAIGVIICNFEDATIAMGAGDDGAQVNIPVLMMHNSDCLNLRTYIGQGGGLRMTLKAPSTGTGPAEIDGDFDNGIIAHEFGHGISNRLVGGPSNAGCLGNGEQMGEGWSDFFSLVTTVKAGDTGAMPRGIGNYATRNPVTGGGIRALPYSTNFSVNNHTYGDIFSSTAVHFIGEVWCTMLWDMYWALVDEYGFDEDLYHGTGGNNIAVQLVMDGMKNLGCNPGFENGRDAIIQADLDRYGGANQLLLWNVFARRGLGFYAEQNSNDITSDGVEDFSIPPLLIKELKMTKLAPDLITAGDEVTIEFEIFNHKETAVSGLTLVDEIPDGATFLSVSDNIQVTQNGNELSFELRDMTPIDTITFSYVYESPADNFSIRQWYDDMEDEYNTTYSWAPFNFNGNNNNSFLWSDVLLANSGVASWAVNAPAEESRVALISTEPYTISGTQPVLRFYHNFNTEPGADGGTIEITTGDDPFAATWERIGDKIFRNPYSGLIQYGTFVIPNYETFWGNSNGWIASYIDLSDYAGQDVYVRFHYATDANNDSGPGGYLGWFIDDFEFMDMVNYDTEAILTSTEGDEVRDRVSGRGTVVESQELQVSNNNIDEQVKLDVFPNPADDFLYLYVSSKEAKDANITLTALDGRSVINRAVQINNSTQTYTLDTESLPAGFYFVNVQTAHGTVVKKVVIR